MGVQKRKDGMFEAYGYVPKKRRKPGEGTKRYLGRRKLKRDADLLLECHRQEMRGTTQGTMTVRDYSARWLEFKHGPGTRRPAPSTLDHNRQMLKPFLEDYGAYALDGIPRNEALDWCLKHRSSAKCVSAMFNDAVNDSLIKANVFANRQHKQMRGRKDITPITEAEVDQLAQIALDVWGEYGRVCRAWILWSAWVGSRPGETFALTWQDVDLHRGEATIRRVKPPYNTDVVPVARKVLDALREMRSPLDGFVFKTVTGKRLNKGSYGWYWREVRAVFEAGLTPERREKLREKRDKPLELYTLRHHCASQIVARGGNEYDCAAMLGNTPEVCRENYIHEYAQERRARLRSMLDEAEVLPLRVVREETG